MTLRYLALGGAVSLGLFAVMLSIVGAFAQTFLVWTSHHTRVFPLLTWVFLTAILLMQYLRRRVRAKPGRVGQ